ncbi:hypothetical protein L21SP3_01446 [Sedimentisphaera cyanobacteriorum]|uniref:Uncharacterized protein n=1 Tax=Sedimentisphaera cyanobacteriorum TaxID=1940790 RepID=A0A1Q2HQC1_9BACT|nr:hypothetical protein [Sedimentisphaera cyanobacteriorum]AQQ09638.1 hypothetical protein L21SP3_01446 [Sedimentisphaera cyanobacteriorum]
MQETGKFEQLYKVLDKWLSLFDSFEQDMHCWLEALEDEEGRAEKAAHLQEEIYSINHTLKDSADLFEDCIFALEYNNHRTSSETLNQQFSNILNLLEILEDRAEGFFNENPYENPARKLQKDDCLSGGDYFNYNDKLDCLKQTGPFAYSSAISGNVCKMMETLRRLFGNLTEEVSLLGRAFDEIIKIEMYLHLILTQSLNRKTGIIDLRSISESSVYLLCLVYDLHREKKISAPYTDNLGYRIREHFSLDDNMVSKLYEIHKSERPAINYEASNFWASILKKDFSDAEQIMDTITICLKNKSWEHNIDKNKLEEFARTTRFKIAKMARLLERYLDDYVSEKHPNLWRNVILYRLKNIRNIIVYFAWATGPYILSKGKDWAVGIENDTENSLGFLSVRFFSIANGVEGEFVPEHKQAERISWVVNPIDLSTSIEVYSRKKFLYEKKLFETWLSESGQYYNHPEIDKKAYWRIDIKRAILLEEESHIAQWAIEKLKHNKESERLANESERLLRNGNLKWQPCNLEWGYVNKLDKLIAALQNGSLDNLEQNQLTTEQEQNNQPVNAENKIKKEQVGLKTVHKSLIKAFSEILNAENISEITRDAVVRKTSYSVGSGNVNSAYKELKDWGIIKHDGQEFTAAYQHYKNNPPS